MASCWHMHCTCAVLQGRHVLCPGIVRAELALSACRPVADS